MAKSTGSAGAGLGSDPAPSRASVWLSACDLNLSASQFPSCKTGGTVVAVLSGGSGEKEKLGQGAEPLAGGKSGRCQLSVTTLKPTN